MPSKVPTLVSPIRLASPLGLALQFGLNSAPHSERPLFSDNFLAFELELRA